MGCASLTAQAASPVSAQVPNSQASQVAGKTLLNSQASQAAGKTHAGGDAPAYGEPPPAGEMAKLVGQGSDVKDNNDWIAESLKYHNELRALHGAPPLKWSAECAAKAQLAADACAAKDTLFHSHCQEYGHGQNAFGGTAGHYGAKEAVEAWYSELTDPGYKWDEANSPNGCPGTGHFTQVVWKDALEVGMACDVAKKGFIVANYWPAGNMQGIYDKNVFKQGTSMQKRKMVRREPFSKEVTKLDDEVQSVLDSIPQEDIAKDIIKKLSDGWSVQLDYKPSPSGSLAFKFKKGGAMSGGSCQF